MDTSTLSTMTPQELGQMSMRLQGMGAIMGAVGAFQGALAQRQSLEFQAQMARINAALAEKGAQAAMVAGRREVNRSQLATAQLKGRQRAGLAASGVDLGVGSAARILTDTDVMGEIDANTLEANAVRAAWGYKTQAVNLGNEARMAQSAASGISPTGDAAASLLSSAGQVASGWYRLAGTDGPAQQYNYTGDAAGMRLSATGASVMARR